jgi:hypothetical protein
MAENSLKTENDNQMKEWDKAREVLKDYDERLHELRKYGFSFLTGLLTVDVFATKVITNATTPTPTPTAIPEIFNLGIFLVTLILIIALHLLDKNYRVFQQAANTRANVIERKLNLELSETMTERHRMANVDWNVFFVYLLFILGTTGIGATIIYPNWNLMWWLIGCALVTLVFIIYQSIVLRLQFRNKVGIKFLAEDWTVSPLECTEKDAIRITLNNFQKTPIKESSKEFIKKIINKFNKKPYTKYDKSISFEEDKPIWRIIDKHEKTVYSEPADKKIIVYDNFTWVVKLKDFKFNGPKEGVFRLWPRDWPTPLPISIIVHELPPKEQKPKDDIKKIKIVK